MNVRYCAACDEEFRPGIEVCSDCGAPLEDREVDESGAAVLAPAGEDAAAPGQADVERPIEDYGRVLSTVDGGAVRRAAARLARAGLQFRVNGNATGYDLLVLRDEFEAAVEVLGGRAGAVSLAPEADAASSGVCPACGAAVAAGVVECPECGLVVGGEPEEE